PLDVTDDRVCATPGESVQPGGFEDEGQIGFATASIEVQLVLALVRDWIEIKSRRQPPTIAVVQEAVIAQVVVPVPSQSGKDRTPEQLFKIIVDRCLCRS